MTIIAVMGDDNKPPISEDLAFQAVVGFRDVIGIAQNNIQPPTYEHALRLIYDVDSDLYDRMINVLSEKNENDTVKLYKEEAKLQSLSSKQQVNPEDLMQAEIDRLQGLKKQSDVKAEDVRHIDKRIIVLKAGIENLKPRKINENAILNKDIFQTDRQDELWGEKVFSDYKHVDYRLAPNNYLRLRLLHPDQGEKATGADLVYEQYDLEKNQIRFIFLQYKTWDGTLYFNENTNLPSQVEKMKQSICDCRFCDAPAYTSINNFRLPHCAAFLRPTDKFQIKNSKMVSSGLHLPICFVSQISQESNKLEKKELRKIMPGHQIFEKLFNLNMIGSRWMNIDEIEEYYQKTGILARDESLIIYAREFMESKDSIKVEKKGWD